MLTFKFQKAQMDHCCVDIVNRKRQNSNNTAIEVYAESDVRSKASHI